MSMPRNRDIRGFFTKAAAPGPSSSVVRSQPAASPQPVRDPHSSPSTPPKPTPRPLHRTDEIKASDDEDGDSDDSLESITALIERKTGPIPHKRDHNLTSTPRAKRTASSSAPLIKSPLTIQPKHKYDLKYLVNHARQSDRADESARRADELINQSEDDDGDVEDEAQNLADVQNDPALLQKTAKELLNDDEEEAKGDKLMRAMNRTKVDGSRRVHYFFNLEKPLLKPPRRTFPPRLARGCWRCLADSRTRDQAIILGLPHAMVSKGKALPDELFLWILDEICVEKNAQLRVQYCNLVALCPDSIARLVSDTRLYSMLERIGGPKYTRGYDSTKLQSLPKVEDPYPGRDWTGLVAFLELLEGIAPNINSSNVIGATQLLLRMALDPLVSTTVRAEHAAAMQALVGALPKVGTRQWNDACATLSSYLLTGVALPTHRIQPIAHMPATTSKLQDLRRRMAAAALFPSLFPSGQPVDDVLSLADVLHRLEQPDFRVGPATDYEHLRALVALLDLVIGGAGFIMQQHSSPLSAPRRTPDPSSPRKAKGSSDSTITITSRSKGDVTPNNNNNDTTTKANPAFDADIDILTQRLKTMHDRIHDSTLLSRKVAKASIDLVAKRLTYAVRTRPPPKTSIFDPEPGNANDADLPRQREFMKNWAQKKAARSGAGPAN
ncbi:hypothetical protein AAE478_008402 [Parahypoxylon ruwenzoriense]